MARHAAGNSRRHNGAGQRRRSVEAIAPTAALADVTAQQRLQAAMAKAAAKKGGTGA